MSIYGGRVNSLPNDKDWFKFKAFADDKLNTVVMMISLFDGAENTVGKGENAGNQHFLLLPQCFPKSSSLRWLKSQDCVVQSYSTLNFSFHSYT